MSTNVIDHDHRNLNFCPPGAKNTPRKRKNDKDIHARLAAINSQYIDALNRSALDRSVADAFADPDMCARFPGLWDRCRENCARHEIRHGMSGLMNSTDHPENLAGWTLEKGSIAYPMPEFLRDAPAPKPEGLRSAAEKKAARQSFRACRRAWNSAGRKISELLDAPIITDIPVKNAVSAGILAGAVLLAPSLYNTFSTLGHDLGAPMLIEHLTFVSRVSHSLVAQCAELGEGFNHGVSIGLDHAAVRISDLCATAREATRDVARDTVTPAMNWLSAQRAEVAHAARSTLTAASHVWSQVWDEIGPKNSGEAVVKIFVAVGGAKGFFEGAKFLKDLVMRKKPEAPAKEIIREVHHHHYHSPNVIDLYPADPARSALEYRHPAEIDLSPPAEPKGPWG